MFIPFVNRKRSIQCPISGTKFWHNGNTRKRAACLRAQQAFTSDLIIELDGDNASGIRRTILSYVEQYSRRLSLAA